MNLPVSKNGSQCGVLMTYNATVQAYGTFISGFDWQIFGTGTFRKRMTVANAERLARVFFDRLSRDYLMTPIAYIAVHERRTSGCGLPAIPCHWHFVAAAPPRYHSALLRGAKVVWRELCGEVDVRPYNNQQSGGFYLAKLAGDINFEYQPHNLDRMSYHGPKDLYQSFMVDAYIPDHFRYRTSGETLVVRRRRDELSAA